MSANRDLVFFSGEQKTITVTIYDEDEATVDLTGGTGWFTIKDKRSDTDPGKMQKTITVLNQVTYPGQCTVAITTSDWTSIDPGEYYYDLKIKLSSGDIYYPLYGQVTVRENVTTKDS